MTSSAAKFGIRSRRVITSDGIKEAIILIEGEKIASIVELSASRDTEPVDTSVQIEDLGNLVVMPGLVDSHVHVNEPGRTEWEGFHTATRAAAAGGITTITDMPLNSDPVTTTLDAFEIKLAETDNQLWVDTTFWGGVVPGNAQSLEAMLDHGVRGFKCFLIHSGIDDFPNVTEDDLRVAMPILARRNSPLLVHAELECGEPHLWDAHPGSYQLFLDSRPRRWENEAIKLMIDLCREYECPVHIVHLSSSEAIPLIKSAKDEGLPITAETCPHYLTFAAEEIKDGDPRYKCAPPIREAENRELLWRAVKDGTIDFIVSDHSPCTPHLKYLGEGDMQKAWGGISSLQFGLSTIWTEAGKRGAQLTDIARWMCQRPAEFINLSDRKGRLAVGFDADIVVFNPDESQTIHEADIHHRHKVTPYDGLELKGVVKQTYVRGKKVFDKGQFSPAPLGQKIVTTHTESRR